VCWFVFPFFRPTLLTKSCFKLTISWQKLIINNDLACAAQVSINGFFADFSGFCLRLLILGSNARSVFSNCRNVEIRWRCRHYREQENLAHAARRTGGHIFLGLRRRWQHDERKCTTDRIHLWLDGGHNRPGNYAHTNFS